jgi:hypothetical protein
MRVEYKRSTKRERERERERGSLIKLEKTYRIVSSTNPTDLLGSFTLLDCKYLRGLRWQKSRKKNAPRG